MANGPFSLGGLTITDLGKRVWSEMSDDNVFDAAAQLGYYFMLALFPLLIFLLSLVGLIADERTDLVTPMMTTLRDVMPTQAYDLVGTEIQRILESSGGGLLTFGMLGTIWAASSGVASLIGTLNRAYEATERRTYVKLRAVAIALTIALVVLLVLGSVLITMGDQIVEWVTSWLGLDWLAWIAGNVVNYLLGFALLFAALEVIYYFGPNIPDQKWHWISPGSLVGVALFIVSSLGFSLYVRFNDSYSVTYGSIGAVIVLLLWLYLLGLSIVIGAEVNSEIAKEGAVKGHPEAPDENVGTAEARKDAAARTPAGSGSKDEGAEAKPDAARPAAKRAGEAGAKAPDERPAATGAPAPRPEAPRAASGPGAKPRPLVDDKALAPYLQATAAESGARELVLRDLLTALVHENARVRAGAAMTLGQFRPTEGPAIALLVTRLGDDDLEVREAASRALDRIGEAAIPALAEAAATEENVEARRAAELTLARIRRAA